MATRTIFQGGNWSNPTTWLNQIKPTSGADDSVSNPGYTVYIDENFSVSDITTSTSAGLTPTFILNNGVSFTCTKTTGNGGITVGATGVPALQFTGNSISTFNGSIIDMPLGTNYIAIQNNSTGTLNLNGNYKITTLLTSANTRTCINHIKGTSIITGKSNDNIAFSDSTLYYSGSTSPSTFASSTATTTLAVYDGIVNIYGKIEGATSSSAGTSVVYQAGGSIYLLKSPVITAKSSITSNINIGIYTVGGLIYINGDITGSSNASAIYNPPLTTTVPTSSKVILRIGQTSDSIVTAGTFSPAVWFSTIGLNDNFAGESVVNVYDNGKLVNNSTTGVMCISAAIVTTSDSATSGWNFYNYPATTPTTSKWLVQTGSVTYPNPSDVRSGTTYDYAPSIKTGTCVIPSAANVLQGVQFDVSSVGTMTVTTPDSFWAYPTTSSFTVGSIGERLKNASTDDTTGNQITSFTS